MDLESVFYPLWGTSAFVGPHVHRQLDKLEDTLPASFKGRHTHDLGCGDGKVTLLLEKILRPASLICYDSQTCLVKRACARGLEARLLDLDRELPRGELAVMWGVLHHLTDAEGMLRKLKENYRYLLIREPLKFHIDSWIELGHPMRRRKFVQLVENALPGALIRRCGGSMFVFYSRPGCP
jgi:trans-aconitate methyltransferase